MKKKKMLFYANANVFLPYKCVQIVFFYNLDLFYSNMLSDCHSMLVYIL